MGKTRIAYAPASREALRLVRSSGKRIGECIRQRDLHDERLLSSIASDVNGRNRKVESCLPGTKARGPGE